MFQQQEASTLVMILLTNLYRIAGNLEMLACVLLGGVLTAKRPFSFIVPRRHDSDVHDNIQIPS